MFFSLKITSSHPAEIFVKELIELRPNNRKKETLSAEEIVQEFLSFFKTYENLSIRAFRTVYVSWDQPDEDQERSYISLSENQRHLAAQPVGIVDYFGIENAKRASAKFLEYYEQLVPRRFQLTLTCLPVFLVSIEEFFLDNSEHLNKDIFNRFYALFCQIRRKSFLADFSSQNKRKKKIFFS